jgi:hypothetical protein
MRANIMSQGKWAQRDKSRERVGNRAEARKSRARAGSAGCDRRTMRTDGSRAAALVLPSPRVQWREALRFVERFCHPKKVRASIAVNVTFGPDRGGEQCTRAGQGGGMRMCVCVCVCDGLCKRVCGLWRPGVTWHAPRSSRLI